MREILAQSGSPMSKPFFRQSKLLHASLKPLLMLSSARGDNTSSLKGGMCALRRHFIPIAEARGPHAAYR